ncbi:MAG: hypothetical protein OGMRLDGQ_000093 [Candidatus Fervidibacter sp.]
MAEPHRIKVMPIFGTRPEAIKMAPVVHALSADENFELVITVTAQHREMLDQFLRFFEMQPRYDLNIMREGQTLADITSRAVEGIDKVLRDENPDLVLVQGDTTTAFVGALVAYYHKIPCGHIEAGLRTGDKFAPFPEEINRKLIGAVADLHFAPTLRATGNPSLLRKSGTPRRVFVAVSETKRAGRKNPALNPSLDGNFLALLGGAVESGQHLHNGDTIVSIRQRFPAFLDAGYELPHLLKVGVAFVHS